MHTRHFYSLPVISTQSSVMILFESDAIKRVLRQKNGSDDSFFCCPDSVSVIGDLTKIIIQDCMLIGVALSNVTFVFKKAIFET